MTQNFRFGDPIKKKRNLGSGWVHDFLSSAPAKKYRAPEKPITFWRYLGAATTSKPTTFLPEQPARQALRLHPFAHTAACIIFVRW